MMVYDRVDSIFNLSGTAEFSPQAFCLGLFYFSQSHEASFIIFFPSKPDIIKSEKEKEL